MAKTKTAAAVADTSTTTGEIKTEATATEASSTVMGSGDTGATGEGTGAIEAVEKNDVTNGDATTSGVDLVDTAIASPLVGSVVVSVDGGGAVDAAAVNAEGEVVLDAYDKPKTAAEALELVKQFYSQTEFAQAVAELNGASTAAAKSIGATVISEDNFYRVLSPLEHNQKVYGIGTTVLLTNEEAAPLVGRAVEAI